MVPRFLDGEIDGKDRSLVGAYISREGGYGDRRERGRERERKKEKKQEEKEEEEEEEGAGGKRGMVPEVSRLVTLVTEHRLAEKRKRIMVRCSVIEKISLSLHLSARSNREPVYVLARGRVCTKRASPEAFGYVVLQTEGEKRKSLRERSR